MWSVVLVWLDPDLDAGRLDDGVSAGVEVAAGPPVGAVMGVRLILPLLLALAPSGCWLSSGGVMGTRLLSAAAAACSLMAALLSESVVPSDSISTSVGVGGSVAEAGRSG